MDNKYLNKELLINDLVEMYKYYFYFYCLYSKNAQKVQDDSHYIYYHNIAVGINNKYMNSLTTILEMYKVNIEDIQKEVKENYNELSV